MSDFSEETAAPAESVEAPVEAATDAPTGVSTEVLAEAPAEAPAEVVAEAPVKEKKSKKNAGPDIPKDKTFKRGDAGQDIRTIQKYLNANGFTCPENGIFCTYTHKAVIKFQESVGIEANGIITQEILAMAK